MQGHIAADLLTHLLELLAMKRPKPTPGLSPWYDIEDMMALFSVGDRTIWKWVSAGKLPRPVRRGPKWSRWPRVQIDALIQEWAREGLEE